LHTLSFLLRGDVVAIVVNDPRRGITVIPRPDVEKAVMLSLASVEWERIRRQVEEHVS